MHGFGADLEARYNAALYLPNEGPYSGRGRWRQYGRKQLDYRDLPLAFLKATFRENHLQTTLYQMTVWRKKSPAQLNVVIIIKTHQRTGAQAHVLLFSSDLALGYEKLIDYYRWRFRMEICQSYNLHKSEDKNNTTTAELPFATPAVTVTPLVSL